MQTEPILTPHDGTALISFIIPVYNVPVEMLRLCLDSILALSLSPSEREIIVVDDGSTEPFIHQLSDYERDIIYVRQPNGGVSTARNTGLRMAKGTFVQFIDADDMLVKQPYQHVLSLINQPQTDLVMFDFETKPNRQAHAEPVSTGPMTGAELMRSHNIHGSACGLIFKRANLGTLCFTPGVAYCEDEEFTPQLLLRSEQVYLTNARAYYYRERTGSAIHSTAPDSHTHRLDDAKGVILHLQQLADTLPTEERIALQRRTAQLTMDYIYNIIILTRDRNYLDEQLKDLQQRGLFPLPQHDYTRKYKWFRRLSSSSLGLSMLMHILPLLKREQ